MEELPMELQSSRERSSSPDQHVTAAQARRLEAKLDLNKDRSVTQSSHSYEPITITTDTDGEVVVDVHRQSITESTKREGKST